MLDAFMQMLRRTQAPENCANPYTVFLPGIDATEEAGAIRARQLRSYLERRLGQARLLLIAEAPGYQGARFSGIAMTCERTLLNQKPGVPACHVLQPGDTATRTSAPQTARNQAEAAAGFSEPTASIVWKELLAHGIADKTVLWNAFPFHPHKPGAPLTNRTPTETEVTAMLPVAQAFFALFPGAAIITIGRTSQTHLARLGIDAPPLRHPANGGAGQFREGLRDVLAQNFSRGL